MADVKKQCRKCEYWTGCNGHSIGENCFCHHLLYTEKRRVEVDGVCQSVIQRETGEGNMKQSGFLKRQADRQEDMSMKIQLTTRQFMIDTLQIALREDLGWGFDRIMTLTNAWEKRRTEYTPAIDPRDAMCDVKQEHMQRVFKDICASKKLEPMSFKERYPYLKGVRYDRKYK